MYQQLEQRRRGCVEDAVEIGIFDRCDHPEDCLPRSGQPYNQQQPTTTNNNQQQPTTTNNNHERCATNRTEQGQLAESRRMAGKGDRWGAGAGASRIIGESVCGSRIQTQDHGLRTNSEIFSLSCENESSATGTVSSVATNQSSFLGGFFLGYPEGLLRLPSRPLANACHWLTAPALHAHCVRYSARLQGPRLHL